MEKNTEEILKEKQGSSDDAAEARLYELGYHIVPTVAEEAIGEEVSKIKDVVEGGGGVITSDEMPRQVSLAYRMPKVIKNKRTFYSSAYFGWIRFQAPAQEISELSKKLEENPVILRFILFKTKETKAMRPPRSMRFFKTAKFPQTQKTEEKPGKEASSLSEAELEKTVEELIAE